MNNKSKKESMKELLKDIQGIMNNPGDYPYLSEYSRYMVAKLKKKIGRKDPWNGHVILLKEYKKAADTTGVDLSDITPHIIEEKERFSISIIQVRDEVILKFISDTITPQNVKINGKVKKMTQKNPGDYEIFLNQVDNMPEHLEIAIKINGETCNYTTKFKQP